MAALGGTYVGGSASGWSFEDPAANAAALGLMAPVTTDLTFAPLDGGMTFAGVGDAGLNGTVGGSWSPEPTGNNDILYGHYSANGALSIPQAYNGVQLNTAPVASTSPMTFAPLPTTVAPALTTTAPSTSTTTGADATDTTSPKKKSTSGGGAKKPATKKAAPAKKPANDKPPAHRTVTVKGGDSLSKIAAAHGTTWQKLYALNKGVIGGNPNLIRPGQQLKLP
jgi:LysM repeat protein